MQRSSGCNRGVLVLPLRRPGRGDEAGCHRIDPHGSARLGEQRGHVVQRGLRHRVGDRRADRAEPGDRRDRHDVRIGGLAQMWHRGLREPPRAEHVDLERLAEDVVGERVEIAVRYPRRPARVVDEDVEPSEPLDRARDQFVPCAWSLMSACTYNDSVGSDSATAVPASTDDDELTTTFAPRSANRRAVASPIPLDEPGHDRHPVVESVHPCASSVCRSAEPTLRAVHVFLETERLILRRFTADDEDLLFELDNDPDVMLYINGGAPVPREEIVDETLPAFLGYYDRFDGYGFWAVIEKDSRPVPRLVPLPARRRGWSAGTRARLPIASLRMEQGLWLGGVSGADRQGIRGARCRAGLRRDDGRQHRLAAGHGEGRHARGPHRSMPTGRFASRATSTVTSSTRSLGRNGSPIAWVGIGSLRMDDRVDHLVERRAGGVLESGEASVDLGRRSTESVG